MAFLTHGVAGARLTVTSTDQKFPLGMRFVGDDGTEWIYAKASAAVTKYDVVAVTSAFTFAPASATTATLANMPAFAQVAFAANAFGWVAVRGGPSSLRVRSAASGTANSQLFVGNTAVSAGVVNKASVTGSVKLFGVVMVSAQNTGVGNKPIYAFLPRFAV